jgi:hypothetical protein
MADELKGFITFFVNLPKEDNRNVMDYVTMVRDLNKAWIERVEREGNYTVIIVPTIGEASRVEKVDFNAPFPLFIPRERRMVDTTTAVEKETK